MWDVKNTLQKIKKSHLQTAGVLLLILLAVTLLWFNSTTSTQAGAASAAKVSFTGEWRTGEGEWQPIEKGAHVPTAKGELTLKLTFRLLDPNGNPMEKFEGVVPVAFYMDHVGLSFYEGGVKVHVADNEHPIIGEPACGESWTVHNVKLTGGVSEPLEIVVRNPHAFGNETAIDEMLSHFAIWSNANTSFEKGILNAAEPQRNTGMLLVLVSVVFFGIALFSSLIHIKNSRVVWLLGLVILSAGLYLAFSAEGVSFWCELVIANTTIRLSSMMFYMFSLSIVLVCLLRGTKKLGNLTIILLAAANAVILLLPIFTDVFFYDTLPAWILIQLAAGAVLAVCLVKEFFTASGKMRFLYLFSLLPLIAFAIDALGTHLAAWKGGLVSQYVFTVLFAIATLMVLRFIPHNINAARKARELELEKTTLNAQLAESRISTMISQIRPHFIYNTLGSIEQLCKLDPPKAGELVHNFAKYLRGNFGELDNPKPILMSQEMAHVHHYVSIENVRFPDMTFSFEMNSADFKIPALTIQPIVENAIKHGLMKLSKGGTIRVVSYETDQHYCVTVEDNGVGFDTAALPHERTHVGLRNIRERLKVMVGGTLEIESTQGVGTRVLISIPKEEVK